jgi:DNA-binding NarL/FixJ family response regulator
LDVLRAEREVPEAFEATVSAGVLDPFVFAYRIEPRILDVLLHDVVRQASVRSILKSAKDERGLRAVGVLQLDATNPLADLTTREQEVYWLLAEGRTNREIAASLFISEATAKIHVRNILKKLDVRNRTEAALLASVASDLAKPSSARDSDEIATDKGP